MGARQKSSVVGYKKGAVLRYKKHKWMNGCAGEGWRCDHCAVQALIERLGVVVSFRLHAFVQLVGGV